MAPSTQYFRCFWRRPLVSYVSEAGGILNSLDAAGLVWRYALGDEQVGVKIKDPLHQVLFGPGFLGFSVLREDGDMDTLLSATDTVWEHLKPSEVRRIDCDFRFLTPIPGQDYNDARRVAGSRAIPAPADIKNVDFAVVGDLASEDPRAQINVEFGVVHGAEAAERLAMDQPALRPNAAVAPTIFPAKSMPDVSIYCRQVWRMSDLEVASMTDALGIWSASREKAEAIDLALCGHLTGESK